MKIKKKMIVQFYLAKIRNLLILSNMISQVRV